ncbi:DNA mismatch repair protein MutS [Weissella cibaria]|uniref:DNA mismatch repair protein MutS n=1 Tax=Weissella cibaria TaxID=137591 RepID=UPI000219193C|nr:DNA mismatch repair protein MutS [Weissella cibaria]APS27048.1 DNA mismatch repair protein MutS [Weissella cibaria]APU62445.1 DNA mismatch repair protein MutS [Weissella cibaria]APU64597.1 DNA mismatch repair protein MutS [Weissella cibaria]ASS52024.1 DNA mismatch repair protein MutS [Weissella cibaria]MCT0955290.1 DNA mismatch repair protein MutS [Weissella cibaria]
MAKPKETPMMKQYNEIKAQYPDAFLFYRLGDFYELFNDDAVLGSQLLELTLTQRNKNSAEPIPMAGVPHHAAQNYIDILVDKGYKVAVVEQMENPAEAEGMVKREVVQLVTPGTRMRTSADAAKENNYLVSLSMTPAGGFGLAYTDLSTGEVKATTVTATGGVLNEISRLETKEIVTNATLPDDLMANLTSLGILVSHQDEEAANAETSYLTQQLTVPEQKEAADVLLAYLFATQKRSLDHLQMASSYEIAQYLKLDRNSRANLELTVNLRTQQRSGTLLWLLDNTKTAMGGRALKQWLEQPLLDRETIEQRYDKIGELLKDFFSRAALQETLKSVYDLERLAGRVAYGTANGRDLLQLRNSLRQVPDIMVTLGDLDPAVFGDLLRRIDPVSDIEKLISTAIAEEPPISVTDGGVIRAGYNTRLDEYRSVMKNGKQWLAELEAKERSETGISSLKIGFNKVFGYYIEVTKANIDKLDPDRYTRKQTLVNAERFITPELKDREQMILEAETKSSDLEYQLFTEVREQIKNNITRIQKLAATLAELDVLQSLATVAEDYKFTRPELTDKQRLVIKDGRHPVVEKVLGHQSYVANDVFMDEDETIMLITGPNMSGKSTYMRQLALTVVMAQIGSYVPASEAELPIFDQIFTRIGAADDLISGNSTFMVEMSEANTAIQNATKRSLILFDELGRGTATYDGMALAQAIIEHVHNNTKAKTLFSTHYHELTALSDELPNLRNVHVGATEENGELVFSHKVLTGPADQSYGINVAKLAGLPDSLIDRAADILANLEAQDVSLEATAPTRPAKLAEPVATYQASVAEPEPEVAAAEPADTQLDLFAVGPEIDPAMQAVLDEIKATNIATMTPLDAMMKLNEWQKQMK